MANPVSSPTHGRFRLGVLVAGLLALSSASAGAHKEIGPRVEPAVPDEVRTGVTAIVEETAKRWSSQDFATLLGLWDPAEPFPTYLAEEQAEWFVGWDRLRAYLDPPRPVPVIEAIRMFAEDVRVKQIAPDLAIGIWNWHFESPKTAAVFLEDLMEKEVRPGWDEFYEQAKQRKREVAKRKQQQQAAPR
jgi:hypothetical protein